MGNNKKSIFLIDFDITISKKDSTDVLLEMHQPEFKQELPGNEQFQKIELLYKQDEKAENEDSKEGEKLNSEEDSEPKAKEEIEKIKE